MAIASLFFATFRSRVGWVGIVWVGGGLYRVVGGIVGVGIAGDKKSPYLHEEEVPHLEHDFITRYLAELHLCV